MLMRARKTNIPHLGVLLRIACIFAVLLSAGCGDRGGGYVIESGTSAGPTGPQNYPPVAKAGNPQSIVSGSPVSLDGSQSFDPNGDSLTFVWNLDAKPAGSNAVLSDSSTVHPTLTPDRSGSYTISLVVSDGKLESSAVTVVITATNTAPVANAGPNQNVDVGTFVTLDGGASSDPNGHNLTYQWTMNKPSGSAAVLSDDRSVSPTFTADVPDYFTFHLNVFDGESYSGSDNVQVSVNRTAIVNAGPDQYHSTGPSSVVTLDGSGSHDSKGRPMTYAWSFNRKPSGSTATLSDPTAVNPSFTADLEGKYELNLQILYNGYVNSWLDTVAVTVITNRPIAELPFKLIDAEYSKQLDRIIMVAGTPSNQLHIYDPVGDLDQTVDLSTLPTSVSVSPDGLNAAIGHNGTISYVNLVSRTVGTTLQVDGNIADIVLAGNGYVYAFPEWKPFVAVNTSTGAVTVTSNSAWGMKAKLHPNGIAIFAALPYGMVKYDISSGPAVYLYDSNPIPGRYYSIGSGLCMTEDGTSIFTYAGNIFSASAEHALDMVPPKKHLDLQFQYAADSSTAAQTAAIPAASWYLNTIIDDTEVWIYDDQSFIFQKSMALPYFTSSGREYPGHGKFLFYDGTGTRLYVIMQADAASGLLNDFVVVTYE